MKNLLGGVTAGFCLIISFSLHLPKNGKYGSIWIFMGLKAVFWETCRVKLMNCIKREQAREKPGQVLVHALSISDQSYPIREWTVLPSRNTS